MQRTQTESVFQEAGTMIRAIGSLMVLWRQNLELKLQRQYEFKSSESWEDGKE